MKTIDLNCDLGESFGAYSIGQDEAIMKFITSANIACGFHAGDPLVMQHTVKLAKQNGIGIGAHPGLPDLQGFGRRELTISLEEAYAMTVYQIGALQATAQAQGVRVGHVKAHGALYNMAAKDGQLARVIVQAAKACDPKLIIVGLSGSEWIHAAKEENMKYAQEVFGDRNYEQDGTLTPRSHSDALIETKEQAASHVLRMIQEGVVVTREGILRPIQADTICIHGDGPHALEFAQYLHQQLNGAGIALSAL